VLKSTVLVVWLNQSQPTTTTKPFMGWQKCCKNAVGIPRIVFACSVRACITGDHVLLMSPDIAESSFWRERDRCRQPHSSIKHTQKRSTHANAFRDVYKQRHATSERPTAQWLGFHAPRHQPAAARTQESGSRPDSCGKEPHARVSIGSGLLVAPAEPRTPRDQDGDIPPARKKDGDY
jgi:hypothetical protein